MRGKRHRWRQNKSTSIPTIAAGKVSVTIAPLTPLGPALLATIVYVTGEPGE